MKKFFEEFKAFAMRGNVIDMAVGVVIGGAFGKITTSIVNDIIMPLISMVTGGVMIVSTLLCFFGPKKPSRREILSVLIGFAGMLALFLIRI